MMIARWGLALALGGFLILFGVMKFTGAHIFQYIEANATAQGLPFAALFHPYVNMLVGAAEIVAGVLIIIPATRRLGALLGTGVLAGAIVFHLSPYLGVNTPSGFSEASDGAPWTLADFTTDASPVLFMIALVMMAIAVANMFMTWRKNG